MCKVTTLQLIVHWLGQVTVQPLLQIKMVGSTFRLLPEAHTMAKFLPLDTISLRYIAWEVLVEVRCQRIKRFLGRQRYLTAALAVSSCTS